MAIEIIGERKTPKLVCGRCKNIVAVDIRPFQEDMSRLAQVDCPHCRTPIFCGLLLLGNTSFEGLLEQLSAINQLFEKAGANVRKIGDGPGSNTKPKLLS